MRFLDITIRAIARHGTSLVYRSVITGAYNPATSRPTLTTTEYTITSYPKQFIANQYNYPTLVGKESVAFYVANSSLGFTPKINDEIEYKNKVYKIQSIQEYFAEENILLYKLIGVRG